MEEDRTSRLQHWVDLLKEGDEDARTRLLQGAYERLRRLARRMLRRFPQVGSREEADDVLQNSVLRLHHALAGVRPESVQGFLCLASAVIRRELIDLARYHGARPLGPPLAAGGAENGGFADPTDNTLEPGRLALWAEFHERIGLLPWEEREVFDLLWYQGLSHAEAAVLLHVSAATVKRRWQTARRSLYQALHGELPA